MKITVIIEMEINDKSSFIEEKINEDKAGEFKSFLKGKSKLFI